MATASTKYLDKLDEEKAVQAAAAKAAADTIRVVSITAQY